MTSKKVNYYELFANMEDQLFELFFDISESAPTLAEKLDTFVINEVNTIRNYIEEPWVLLTTELSSDLESFKMRGYHQWKDSNI